MVILGNIPVVVNIDLEELDILVLGSDMFDLRRHHLAWHAPSTKYKMGFTGIIAYEAEKATNTGAPVEIFWASSPPFLIPPTLPVPTEKKPTPR